MSTINTNSINVNYPIPGINNSSQGFRDNFASIKTNLDAAGTEITDLQNAVVVKTALANTVINNDMGNTLISNASTRGFRATTFNLGSSISGTIVVNASLGDVQYGTIAANTTVQFSGWAPTGTQSNVQLQFNISNANAVISFPTNVSMTGSYGVETLENFANIANIPTITAAAGVTQLDLRFSTVDCGNTINVDPYNRPRQATQIQQRTPSPTGLPGDTDGTIAIDPATSTALAVCTATTTTYNTITCDSTDGFYLDMPINFQGTTFGGITAGTTYYIRTIVSSTKFTISTTPGTVSGPSSAVTLSTASGSMYMSPITYLYLSSGSFNSNVYSHTLVSTTAVTSNTISTNTVASGNIVTLSSNALSAGYAVGQPIVFTGTTSNAYLTNTFVTANTITVSNTTGMVVGGKIKLTGTPFGNLAAGLYYITYIQSANTANSNIAISATFSGSNLSLTSATGNMTGTIGGVLGGITANSTYYIQSIGGTESANLTVSTQRDSAPITILSENGSMNVTATTDYICTLDSTNGINANDPIIFTGNTYGNLISNNVYYVDSVSSPNISVSLTRYNGIAGQKVAVTSDTSANHSVTINTTSYSGNNIWKRSQFNGW